MLVSMCRLVGSHSRLPDLASPPKRNIASGKEKATKLASDSPSIRPVSSKAARASSSVQGGFGYHFGVYLLHRNAPEPAWSRIVREYLQHGTHDAGGGDIGLEASPASTAAQSPAGPDRDVAEFAGRPAVAVHHFAVGNDAAAQSRAERYFDKVSHTPRSAVYHFADGGGIGVVVDDDRQRRVVFLDRLHERDGQYLRSLRAVPVPFIPPDVDWVLGHAAEIVAVRNPDAYARELRTGGDAPERLDVLHQAFHVILEIGVLPGLEAAFPVRLSLRIYESRHGIRTADVDSYGQFFRHVSVIP